MKIIFRYNHIIFLDLGIWNRIEENGRIKTVKQLRVWDSCSTSNINFEHPNFDKDIAYIVENSNIVSSCVDIISDLKPNNLTTRHEIKINKTKYVVDD